MPEFIKQSLLCLSFPYLILFTFVKNKKKITLSHILGRREHTLIASIWNVRRRQRGVCVMTHKTHSYAPYAYTHILEYVCMYVCVCTNTHTAVCTKFCTCSHFCHHNLLLPLYGFIFVVAVAVRGVCVKKCVASVGAGAALSQTETQWTDADRNKIPKTTYKREKHNNDMTTKHNESKIRYKFN